MPFLNIDSRAKYLCSTGLCLALALAYVASHFVIYSLSYDRWLPDHAKLFRIHQVDTASGSIEIATPGPLLDAIRETSYGDSKLGRVVLGAATFEIDGREFQNSVAFTDPDILNMFALDAVHGALTGSSPFEVLVSESAADRIFGDLEIVGRTIFVNQVEHVVRAVFQDYPPNSHIHFDIIVPWKSTALPFREQIGESWQVAALFTYIKTDFPEEFVARLDKGIELEQLRALNKAIALERVDSLSLRYPPLDGAQSRPQAQLLYTLTALVVLILGAAIFNFLTVSISALTSSEKNIWILRLQGAPMWFICGVFLRALFFPVLCASVCGVLIGHTIVAFFGSAIGVIWNVEAASLSALVVFLTGFLAAGVASILPIGMLLAPSGSRTQTLSPGRLGEVVHRCSLVFQFGVASGVSGFLAVVIHQLSYANAFDRGMNYEDVYVVHSISSSAGAVTNSQKQILVDRIREESAVVNATLSNGSPVENREMLLNLRTADSSKSTEARVISVDPSYFSTFRIPIVSGRNLRGSDETYFPNAGPEEELKDVNILLSKSSVAALGMNVLSIVGQTLLVDGARFTVVGTVPDIHLGTAKSSTMPIVFITNFDLFDSVSIRSVDGVSSAAEYVGRVWDELGFSAGPRIVSAGSVFSDQAAQDLEERNYLAVGVFSVGLIVIVGVLARAILVLFAERRRILIFKALGAPNFKIFVAIGRQLVIPSFLGLLLSLPVSVYFIQEWISQYARRSELIWYAFFSGALVPLLVAILILGMLMTTSIRRTDSYELLFQ